MNFQDIDVTRFMIGRDLDIARNRGTSISASDINQCDPLMTSDKLEYVTARNGSAVSYLGFANANKVSSFQAKAAAY
jgi:hypothetical protein